MKKIVVALISVTVAIAVLAASTATLAKYITDVKSGAFSIHAVKFYFRSDVLDKPTYAENELQGKSVSVKGAVANFVIANGANENKITNTDLEYTLSYRVYKDGEAIDVDAMTETHTFTKDVYTAKRFSVSPIVLDGDVYDKVLVIAQSQYPYEETLAALFEFDYDAHSLEYSYDSTMGIITLRVVTNDEGGEYEFSWIEGVLPDNADPNGIFTSCVAGPSSITTTLEAHTNYAFSFFVNPNDREFVDGLLGSMTEAEITEMAKSAVTCTKK